MTLARDWLTTLFDASYKGVPFQVETDAEEGGRRIAVHQFPMRDDPFLEDLGEDKRGFNVTAYVASDRADTEAGEVVAICAQPGAGTLVLPTHGPLNVRCISFKRNRSKDKHGKLALELQFIREGLSAAQPSVRSLANMVFVAADDFAAAMGEFATLAIESLGQPDYVVGAAVDAVRDVAGALEDVRVGSPVSAAVSGAQRTPVQRLFDDAPLLVSRLSGTSSALGSTIMAVARAIGDGIEPPAARGAFLPLLDAFADEGSSSANVNAVRSLARLAALTVAAESVARDTSIVDRPTGITLRADLVELFDAEIEKLVSPAAADVVVRVIALRGAAVDYLSRNILDLAPVISVGSNLPLPSLMWSWRLYADPDRASEIVARNAVAHPSFCPIEMDVLAV